MALCYTPMMANAPSPRAAGARAFASDLPSSTEEPLVPDYGGACVCNVVPGLLRTLETDWLPRDVLQAPTRMLLVLDGLGWEQLQPRQAVAPTLHAMQGRAISTIAPSTTAAALTSISTGRPPAQHGLLGYQLRLGDETLDVLRWTVNGADARERFVPSRIQGLPAFGGTRPPVITKSELEGSGFTQAHLAGAEMLGYRVPSSIAVTAGRMARAGRPFIYAYYDGIDRIAHQRALDQYYDAELATVDRMVADVLRALPSGAALVITADHGHVDVGDQVYPLAEAVQRHARIHSGEARFLWLHAKPGQARELEAASLACHGEQAWVVSRERIQDEAWFGPGMSAEIADRCGDVALVARGRNAVLVPGGSGSPKLGRHGSLTPAEMRVPLLWAIA